MWCLSSAKEMTRSAGRSGFDVKAILEDREGAFWFGTSGQFWHNLQSAYDIRVAARESGPKSPSRRRAKRSKAASFEGSHAGLVTTNGTFWREMPYDPSIALDDASVATSGDYKNFWTDEEGRRRSHVIDPRTGQPITHGLASASVVHADGAWADSLGTALLVLGPEGARALATREHLAVRLLERRSDGSWADWSTPSFQALVVR